MAEYRELQSFWDITENSKTARDMNKRQATSIFKDFSKIQTKGLIKTK